MAQQFQEYHDYPSNRSPGSARGYNNSAFALNRQSSRHFDNFGGQMQPPLYNQDEHARFDQPAQRYDRMPSSTVNPNYQYDSQTWNYGGANGGANTIGGTSRMKQSSRRTGLPPGWMDQQPPMPPLPNLNHYQLNGSQYEGQHSQMASQFEESEELIPTAIVIKNIPFAVKKEHLLELMTEMGLMLPYAFNYHFDHGVFRGLAFANFTGPAETQRAIEVMNHMDLQGRKLRVEYKRMLPVHEREKIEREKRIKRGQLQEQHEPQRQMPQSIHQQPSISSMTSGPHASSPSPSRVEFDLNDPSTLNFYNELMLFKNDPSREALTFPSSISPHDRRIIHTLAHYMGVDHRSEGVGEGRCVQILKRGGTATISPPAAQLNPTFYNENRRGLNRAATIDFSEARETGYHPHTLRNQGSGLLDIPGSPGLGLGNAHNLRAAKSFADLRSYTPSPVPSTASFPSNLAQNVARYTDYGHASATGGPVTPTSAGAQIGGREEALFNSMSNMSLMDRTSNRTNGGRIGQEKDYHGTNAGPIGSQRPVNGNTYEENPRNGATAVPERQPRGPGDWGNGFGRPRQNGHVNRGSGELDLKSFEQGWDDNNAQDSSDRNAPIVRYQ